MFARIFLMGITCMAWMRSTKDLLKLGPGNLGWIQSHGHNFLKEYGWKIIEDVGAEDLVDKYVKPTGRIFASTAIERIISAEKI